VIVISDVPPTGTFVGAKSTLAPGANGNTESGLSIFTCAAFACEEIGDEECETAASTPGAAIIDSNAKRTGKA
jgi:hypothetical protein